jgi:two-component system sensor histidine kinase MprB
VPGISVRADQPFIFDRFWRSASARALPGSGLGLSIVAQVVAELQGTVSVDRDQRTRRRSIHHHITDR